MDIDCGIPIVIGLGFGDEGKGATVDFLASQRETSFVVRFSGGPQTAHNVITDEGVHHTFAQFGAGTLQGAGTIISRYMLINPFTMVEEADALISKTGTNPFYKTVVSENALLITPLHIAANHQREINRGADRHGSCGQGVGETRALNLWAQDAGADGEDLLLTMGSLGSRSDLNIALHAIRDHYMETVPGYAENPHLPDHGKMLDDYMSLFEDVFCYVLASDEDISDLISKNVDTLIFEGSQGVLLDEVHGTHPHTTWSDTTANKALDLLAEVGIGRDNAHIVGVLRTYHTRHGDGPFPSEFSESNPAYPEPHNGWGQWQGDFRIGSFDMELARYAISAVGGVDSISLTHCDRPQAPVITEYRVPMPTPQIGTTEAGYDERFMESIGEFVASVKPEDMTFADMDLNALRGELSALAPIAIEAHGPMTSDRRFV